jgi:2-oxoglutarate ferredoxin oxidoreductase subunit delta
MSIVKINFKKCKGCGLCIRACPRQCISFSEKFSEVGYRYAILYKQDVCTGCGLCYMVCPDVCIEVYR